MLGLLARLMGPMFAKEMVEVSRRKRYYFNRVLYGAALLITLLIVWQENSYRYYYQQQADPRFLAQVAEILFISMSFVQLGAVFLFVPPFLCGVIASEREARTLELLFTSQMSDREIVLGKLGSRVAVLVTLIASALPVVCLTMLFGGVDPASIVRVEAATMLAVLYAAAHSIYFSSASRTPVAALVRTYVWMALWLLALPFAVILITTELIRFRYSVPVAIATHLALAMVNPIVVFVFATIREAYDEIFVAVAGYVRLPAWALFASCYVLPSTWSLWLIYRAVRRLRVEPRPAFGSALISRMKEATRTIRVLAPVRKIGLRKFARSNPLWRRATVAPVYDREGHLGRAQTIGWLVAVGFLGLMLILSPNDLDDEECAMAFLGCTWIGAGLLTGVVSAASLVGDRQRGLFELVLATPLSPPAIVFGTLAAVWEHLRRIYFLAWGLSVLFILTGAAGVPAALSSGLSGTLFGLVMAMTGIACSLSAERVPQALVPTMMLPIVMTVGLPFLIFFFGEDGAGPAMWILTILTLPAAGLWFRRSGTAASVGAFWITRHMALAALFTFWTFWASSHGDAEPIAAVNPGFMIIAPLEVFSRSYGSQYMQWVPPALLMYWLALVINFALLGLWTVKHFNRLTGRTLTAADRFTRRGGVPLAQLVAEETAAESEELHERSAQA